jgi:two-component system cell cycle sensor histidine kinase/response regulator CckA
MFDKDNRANLPERMAKHGHILIVENEAVSAAMIEHQLLKYGYGVAGVAADGPGAIALTEKCRPDLVLMDIGLDGEMDGVEAANIIRSRFEIPIIYLTTNSDENTIERARPTQAHGYLHKPIHAPALHSMLQMALAKSAIECHALEEQRWLATTLRCMRDGVIAVDSLGVVKLLNMAAEKLTGWSAEDAVNRELSEVFRVLEPESRALWEPSMIQTAMGILEGTYSRKVLVARDGTEIQIEDIAAPMINAAGFMTGVVLVFHRAMEFPASLPILLETRSPGVSLGLPEETG